ncbi:MAG TPA: GIY-YIG nuclease family protein [Longimicrobium sp.]|nr:GIY-YIG nuclease family protein [Longimicrobium sp.]
MLTYHVYILASQGRTLYIGFTNDLRRRIYEHKSGRIPGFTCRYNVIRLVHFEAFTDVRDAKRREKQLKGWRRARKIELIEAQNPEWEDLADRIGLPASAVVGTA